MIMEDLDGSDRKESCFSLVDADASFSGLMPNEEESKEGMKKSKPIMPN